ncbi:hypothetical protein EAF04_003658 [Stromatinia cepivora]|nr:hypothetical protein EAF04_003658 [Stromatinia cepivora]
MDHYIVDPHRIPVQTIPAGMNKDTVIQIQIFDVRMLVVVMENCGAQGCLNAVGCVHGSAVKISVAEKRRCKAGWRSTLRRY